MSRTFWLLLGLALLAWVLSGVDWLATLVAVQRLRWWQVGLMVLTNAAVLFPLFGRWWLILRGLDQKVPYPAVFRYGMAGAGVSYFTPGPQFGGEPLQLLLLHKNHGVPMAAAAASVAVDKGLTLLINLTFLLLGAAYTLTLPITADLSLRWAALWVVPLLMLPVVLLASWLLGRRPLTSLLHQLPASFLTNARPVIAESEQIIITFCQQRPQLLWAAVAFSLFTWLLMIGEYWLMATLIGLPLSLGQAVVLLTAVRLAWLLPMPSGLGSFEAAQIGGLALIGFTALEPLGVTLALLIRLRDVSLGLIGLWLVKNS